VQQIAALARQAAQAIVIAGYLAQLKYRRASKLVRIGLAHMRERDCNRFGISNKRGQEYSWQNGVVASKGSVRM